MYTNTGGTLRGRLARTYNRVMKVLFDIKDNEEFTLLKKNNGLLSFENIKRLADMKFSYSYYYGLLPSEFMTS